MLLNLFLAILLKALSKVGDDDESGEENKETVNNNEADNSKAEEQNIEGAVDQSNNILDSSNSNIE